MAGCREEQTKKWAIIRLEKREGGREKERGGEGRDRGKGKSYDVKSKTT